MKKLSISLVLLVASAPLVALAANTTYYGKSITGMGVWGDGHTYITISGVTSTACATDRFSLGLPSDAKHKNMVALAQSALLSGKLIDIISDGTCQGNEEKIAHLKIIP